MFRPLVLFIGVRYTGARRRTRFISFITLTSVLGIALGVTALITVLSVMNGFETELRERILGMTSHASISGWNGRLDDWRSFDKLLEKDKRVTGWAPYIEGQGMVSAGRRVSGSLLKGVLPDFESRVSEVTEKLVMGDFLRLAPGDYGIILGTELASHLGVSMGDKVTVITPQINSTPAGILPRLRRFTVVGVFKIGMYEYDRNLALIHLGDAARLYRLGNSVSGLRLKLAELFEAPQLTADLSQALYGSARVTDWTRVHSNFFRAIRTEKRVMFIILLLIVAVAAFNIVSTLVMVVTDKKSDIAILMTQGMTPGSVMGIFMVLGTIIGLVGTALGTLGGVLLALNVETIVPVIEQAFGAHFLPADVYYISELPSKLVWSDVYLITSVAFLLALLATVYPAIQAAKVKPAEELRYE